MKNQSSASNVTGRGVLNTPVLTPDPRKHTVLHPGEVLVVIDMQPGFPASQDAVTQWFVKQEIERAIKLNLPILLVDYDSHEMGEIYPEITNLVKGYRLCKPVSKHTTDGSKVVALACIKHGFSTDKMRFCGVNSDACVLETVQGLINKLPDCHITVVQDACNCLTGKTNDVWDEDFPMLPRVHVELHGQSRVH